VVDGEEMKIEKVISGGQTGVDTAGLRAAARCGITTGGTAPRGFLTEIGPRKSFLKKFGLVEHSSDKYPPRTLKNIRDSDATLVIAETLDTGSGLTIKFCREQKKPVKLIKPSKMLSVETVENVVAWIEKQKVRSLQPRGGILNIAGNRESKSPGIEAKAMIFLVQVFRRCEDEQGDN
jgi:hypothetical protein